MNWFSLLRRLLDWLSLLCRLFGAGILCVFAYVPLMICYSSIGVVVAEPNKFDLTFVAVFFGSAAVAYLLLLLAFRAATGRGRKGDGGLLPPLAMKSLFAIFGVIAIGIVGMGIWHHELPAILGGAAYLMISYGAWRSSGRKPLNELLSIEFDEQRVQIHAEKPLDEDWNQSFEWAEIKRVCFQDAGLDSSDRLFLELHDRETPVVVLTEAKGGVAFFGALCDRGYFPEHVWRRAIGDTSGGTHCWPKKPAGTA